MCARKHALDVDVQLSFGAGRGHNSVPTVRIDSYCRFVSS